MTNKMEEHEISGSVGSERKEDINSLIKWKRELDYHRKAGKKMMLVGAISLILTAPPLLLLDRCTMRKVAEKQYNVFDEYWYKAVVNERGIKVSGFDRLGPWERRFVDIDNDGVYDLEKTTNVKYQELTSNLSYKELVHRYKQVNIPMSELEKWTCLEVRRLENEERN